MLEDVPYDQLLCTHCGRPLFGGPEDQPYWPTGPMCADCYQAREMDNDLWMAELNAEENAANDDEL